MDIRKKLLKTIEFLEENGAHRPIAEKKAYARATEYLQKMGMPIMASIQLVEKALQEIKNDNK